MSRSHNKKRNTGLLYEFLIKTISRGLVEGNERRSREALKILQRRFKKGTEMYRELRLCRSLVKTTVGSEAVAASIVSEARTAARKFDYVTLDKEKSLLIRDINYSLGGKAVYGEKVEDYKAYATVGSLLNDWRSSSDPDLSRIARFEDTLVTHLLSEKTSTSLDDQVDPDADRLVVKIMSEKLNRKYSQSLSEDQRNLVKAYVLPGKKSNVKNQIEKIREDTVTLIDSYVEENKDSEKFLSAKLIDVKEKILKEDLDSIDDQVVARFMEVSRLKREIEEKE